jgi:hypothetical protein
MKSYRIRYNQTAGQPGRGSVDHKWRVFDQDGKEWICKSVQINVRSWTDVDRNGHDYNIVCWAGSMEIDKINSIITLDKI